MAAFVEMCPEKILPLVVPNGLLLDSLIILMMRTEWNHKKHRAGRPRQIAC